MLPVEFVVRFVYSVYYPNTIGVYEYSCAFYFYFFELHPYNTVGFDADISCKGLRLSVGIVYAKLSFGGKPVDDCFVCIYFSDEFFVGCGGDIGIGACYGFWGIARQKC